MTLSIEDVAGFEVNPYPDNCAIRPEIRVSWPNAGRCSRVEVKGDETHLPAQSSGRPRGWAALAEGALRQVLPVRVILVTGDPLIEEQKMNPQAPTATLPAAWLRPLPAGQAIPIWRWVLLPATTLMLKRYGGVWVSGELKLLPGSLHFAQSRLVKSSRTPPAVWSIPLATISDVTVQKGVLSETLEIRHAGTLTKMMTARSADFVAQLNQAISSQPGEAAL